MYIHSNQQLAQKKVQKAILKSRESDKEQQSECKKKKTMNEEYNSRKQLSNLQVLPSSLELSHMSSSHSEERSHRRKTCGEREKRHTNSDVIMAVIHQTQGECRVFILFFRR